MEPKIDPKELRRVNGDIVLSLNKDLARIWARRADRFLNQDLYNYFSEDTLKGRLTLPNRSQEDLEGKYEIVLKDRGRVLFHFEDAFASPKNKVRQFAQLAIQLPVFHETAQCRLEVRLTYAGGAQTYENGWEIWVYPRSLTRTKVHLWDPTGRLIGIEELFNVERLSSSSAIGELGEGAILVTTAFDEAVESLAADLRIGVIAIQKGEGYFPLTYNPFYREGVKVILDHRLTDGLGHIGYAGMQFYGVGTGCYFDKLELEKRIGSYIPLIRRYDARKFKTGDYLFAYAKGRGQVLVTSAEFGRRPGKASPIPSGITTLRYGCCTPW